MTPLPLSSNKVLNLDNVTWAEWTQWRVSQMDGSIRDFVGVIVHFVGGTVVKLTGEDAAIAALKLGVV